MQVVSSEWGKSAAGYFQALGVVGVVVAVESLMPELEMLVRLDLSPYSYYYRTRWLNCLERSHQRFVEWLQEEPQNCCSQTVIQVGYWKPLRLGEM